MTFLAAHGMLDGCNALERRAVRAVARVTDTDIAAGMGRGERWAARLLYDRIHEPVDRTLRRVLKGRGASHDDLYQAAFEHIVRVLTERPQIGVINLPAWSAVVASRLAVDWLRRRAREEQVLGRLARERGAVHASIDRRLEARSDLRSVSYAIARMQPKHFETVVLHDIVGHDVAEIANLTDVSVAAAQSRLVRGRRELLRRLRGRGALCAEAAPHSQHL